MRGLMRRGRLCLGIVGLAVALAACETVPPAPLLSPLEVAKSYGYSEVSLGEDRDQVTFVGPTRRSLRSEASRQPVAAEEATPAYYFAIWRAVTIAHARVFPAF